MSAATPPGPSPPPFKLVAAEDELWGLLDAEEWGGVPYALDPDTLELLEPEWAASAPPSPPSDSPSADVCMVSGCGKEVSKRRRFARKTLLCETHVFADRVDVRGGAPAQRYCFYCHTLQPLRDFNGARTVCAAAAAVAAARRRAKKLATPGCPPALTYTAPPPLSTPL